MEIKERYDLAVCHALLLHIPKPKEILQKMVNSLITGGKIICFEPHWISNMSSYYLHGHDQSQVTQLGTLQRLFEEKTKQTGKDGNIGVKIPHYLSELGLKNIECRLSDKVNFLSPRSNSQEKEKLFQSLKEDGLGAEPKDRVAFIEGLINYGISQKEAQAQYEAESLFAEIFNNDSSFVCSPSMKITFGDK